VNKGILDLNLLEPVMERNKQQSGVTMTKRIDNRIPEMTPLYCLDQLDICLMKIGELIVVPIYNHFGNANMTEPCKW
jgi:hypothetical protein